MSYAISVSGAKGAQSEIATISNNLANAQTTGFKSSRVQFGDLFAAGASETNRPMTSGGVRLQRSVQKFAQGTLVDTGRGLDLAITGEGFFISKDGGLGGDVSYTRAGSFQLSPDRFVVDSRGARLQLLALDASEQVIPGSLIDFQAPATASANPAASLVGMTISEDGLVACSFSDGSRQALGKVALAGFTAPEGLAQIGDAHWRATEASGAAEIVEASSKGWGDIRSGTLENANVDVTEEMVALMVAQRNFQANAKAIEIQSGVSQAIINLR